MRKILTEIDRYQKEIDSFRPFSKHLLKQLREYYRVGLTYASNALEGNSLTETETKIVLEEGITIGGKSLKEHYEVIGHGEAYDLMYQLAKKPAIKEADVKGLHKLFYRHIDDKNAGEYRKEQVFISGSKYTLPKPQDIGALMKNFIGGLEKAEKKFHPVEYAALAHKEFVFIHPFIDGNGRVARLLMNLIFLQKSFVVAIIPPVLRVEYVQALEAARKDDRGFMKFIARTVREGQMDYLRLLRS